MRTVEPRGAAVFLRFGAQPDDREGDDSQQHGDGEEVLQEAKNVPSTDHREVELGVEQHAIGLEVHRRQDEEAPHREEVRDAGDRPGQQSGLAENLFDLVSDPLAHVVFAAILVANGLAAADQLCQPCNAFDGEKSDDGRHGEADDQPDENLRIHGVPLQLWQLPSGNLAVVTGR